MLFCLISVTLEPKDAKVTPLLSKDPPDFPGKEGLMITVEYPPGGSDPMHRHNADAFVYVLEGSILMQVRGGMEVILTPGCGNLKGTPLCVFQGRPIHRFPKHRWPRSKIPSAHPDEFCRMLDRFLIESPSSFCLLPCSRPGLEPGCNRSRPGSGKRVPWRVPPRE